MNNAVFIDGYVYRDIFQVLQDPGLPFRCVGESGVDAGLGARI